MRQTAFIVATLTGSLLFGASVAGALRAPVGAIGASAAPDANVAIADPEAAQPAALAAAIVRQFPGHAVDVVLEPLTIADAGADAYADGAMQQQLEAYARVRIDGSAPMRMHAEGLYDRESRDVAAPSLHVETDADSRAAGAATRHALAAAVERRLGAEFAGQPVGWSLADAETAAVGDRFLHVVARGIADFGSEGRAATAIDALYDPRTGEWLRLDYALGGDPADADAAEGFAYAGH